MSLKGMAYIERGHIEDPHYSSLSSIAHALDMSVGELVGEPALSGKAEAPPLPEISEEERREKKPDRRWEGRLRREADKLGDLDVAGLLALRKELSKQLEEKRADLEDLEVRHEAVVLALNRKGGPFSETKKGEMRREQREAASGANDEAGAEAG